MIGRELRRVRRDKDLTQEAVAAAAGISQSYLSTIEQDDIDGVTFGTLTRVAQANGKRIVFALADLPVAEPEPVAAPEPAA